MSGLWPVLAAVVIATVWAAGLRLFLTSGLSRSRKVTWSAALVLVGIAIGVILPQRGIFIRFAVALGLVPLLGIADAYLVRSGRSWSFWIRACAFEVCTVFGVAALVRMLLDGRN